MADTPRLPCPPGLPLLQRDFLDLPGRAIALVDDRVRLAVEFVHEAAVLTVVLRGLRPANQFAVEIEPMDPAVLPVRHVDHALGGHPRRWEVGPPGLRRGWPP